MKNKYAYEEYEKSLNEEFSVIVCDVNNLKQVNDTMGHKACDEYIKKALRKECHLTTALMIKESFLSLSAPTARCTNERGN
ncbi:MAG: diguanylate cyclase [Treponema sp.]|nr:diguanylate cyclase [Treponema sp.]